MKHKIETLPVIFRAERSGESKGHVTAVFPTCAADYAGREFMIYAHIGQHGAARLDWYNGTRAARPAEYADLLRELRGIYGQSLCEGDPAIALQVRQRFSLAMRRQWQADARAARDRLRADPSGGPWTPDAREATAAAIAADLHAARDLILGVAGRYGINLNDESTDAN